MKRFKKDDIRRKNKFFYSVFPLLREFASDDGERRKPIRPFYSRRMRELSMMNPRENWGRHLLLTIVVCVMGVGIVLLSIAALNTRAEREGLKNECLSRGNFPADTIYKRWWDGKTVYEWDECRGVRRVVAPEDPRPWMAKSAVKKPPVRTTIASWYGDPFHGRPTACGNKFNKNGLTAASTKLPCGTKIVITNQKNGRTVGNVLIDDSGPFEVAEHDPKTGKIKPVYNKDGHLVPHKDRGLDVSEAVAEALGFKEDGLTIVAYRITEKDS